MWNRRIEFCFCLVLALPGVALAADGAIPLWESVTITQPGSYVVTRNFANLSGPVLVIESDDVMVDLHGFTLTSGSFGPSIRATGNRITIHHGSVINNVGNGVYMFGDGASIHDVDLVGNDDCGLYIGGNRSAVTRVAVEGSLDDGICVAGDQAHVTGNRYGMSIQVSGVRAIVQDNAGGGTLNIGSDSQVLHNVADRLVILGHRNHIEGNLVSLIALYGNDNVYRGNTARGGQWGSNFQDIGTGNTSHGDNYIPTKQ